MGSPDLDGILGLSKPVIVAAILAVLWVLEGVAPEFARRGQRLAHFLRNIALGVMNGLIVAALFAAALLAVTEWARERGFGLLNLLELPWWLAWPLAIVLFDFWMYVWHVLNHKIPFLWRFHAVHHSDAELDASSALRFHTGEIVLSSMLRLAVVPLLGMSLAQLLLYELILLPVILQHHSNIRMPARVDRVLRTIIVTPWMHWVHHSQWQPETDSNYASVFSWWDRLFRTFRLRQDPERIELGLDGLRPEQWSTFKGMLLLPLNVLRRDRAGGGRSPASREP